MYSLSQNAADSNCVESRTALAPFCFIQIQVFWAVSSEAVRRADTKAGDATRSPDLENLHVGFARGIGGSILFLAHGLLLFETIPIPAKKRYSQIARPQARPNHYGRYNMTDCRVFEQ